MLNLLHSVSANATIPVNCRYMLGALFACYYRSYLSADFHFYLMPEVPCFAHCGSESIKSRRNFAHLGVARCSLPLPLCSDLGWKARKDCPSVRRAMFVESAVTESIGGYRKQVFLDGCLDVLHVY